MPLKTSSELAFFGGGPAGIGPIMCAAQENRLEQLLCRSVSIFERAPSLCAGAFAGYAIRSDTRADVLLECLSSAGARHFAALAEDPTTAAVAARGEGPLPLRELGAFLEALGRTVQGWCQGAPAVAFRPRHHLLRIELGTSRHTAVFESESGCVEHTFERGVLALGGYQDEAAMLREPIAGDASLASLGLAERTMPSDRLLREGGIADLAVRLDRRAGSGAEPRIVILGGSHSAFTAAHLLRTQLGHRFGASGIRIYSRRPPRLFFPSAEAALNAGYTDFTSDDICPTTQRLFRLAGLRFDGRETLLHMLGLGVPVDRRCVWQPLSSSSPSELIDALRDCDVVIAALGYRPRRVPILRDGAALRLTADHGGPLVNERCGVLGASGTEIPGLLALGLASGFVPQGSLGGEPSFRGQTNGLWLYQNGVGRIVLDRLLA